LEATEGKEFEGFVSDEIPKRAILRSLEVIGDAVEEVVEGVIDIVELERGGRQPFRNVSWLAGLLKELLGSLNYF